MKKKIGILALVLVVAVAVIGVGVARWSETLTIKGDIDTGNIDTGELDWEFVYGTLNIGDPCTPPTEDRNCDDDFTNIRWVGKDVGCTSGLWVDSDGDGDYDTLELTLDNVYPCYYVHVAFNVHNNGTMPLKIEKAIIDGHEFTALPAVVDLDLDGDGDFDLNISYGNNFGAQLHPCNTADLSFELHVKQGAEQGAQYTFTITIEAVQWNESIHP